MAKIQGIVFCDGCGTEITWTPTYIDPQANTSGVRRAEYCCSDCSQGYRCQCRERMLLEEERRSTPEFPL